MKRFTEEKIVKESVEYIVKYIQMEDLTEYLASKNPDGTFDVPSHKGYAKSAPYVGTFASYKEMNSYKEKNIADYPNGYVCKVSHNATDAYVFQNKEYTLYIRVGEES